MGSILNILGKGRAHEIPLYVSGRAKPL